MRTDNPPRSNFEFADEEERRIRKRIIRSLSIYAIICTALEAFALRRYIHGYAEIDYSMVWIFGVLGLVMVLFIVYGYYDNFALCRRLLGERDPNDFRKPYPLPPINHEFPVRLEDQEPIIISITFYYPPDWQTPINKQRIIEATASTLSRFAIQFDELPTHEEVEAVIDEPLTALAEELRIPVLYATAQFITTSANKGSTIGDLIL